METDYLLDTISLEDVYIGDRFRKDYGDLESFKRSIQKYGIIHPLVVCTSNDEHSEPYHLVAGGRRISALAELGILKFPVRIYDRELTPLELRSIELEENLQRKDMDWQEQVRLQQEIHNLQITIHGEKTSTNPNAVGFSITDTAKLLKRDKSTVARDLQLAQAVDDFPDMQWDECKNKAEAIKLKKRLEEKVLRRELTKRAEKALGSGNILHKHLADAYILKSFFDGVKQIPPGSIDLVEIDPPYAIDLQNQKKDYDYEGYNEVDSQFYEEFMTKTFDACYEVMSPNSWLICWFGPDPWFEPVYQWILNAGFSSTRLTGTWTKPSGQTNNPSRRLARTKEDFFYAWKGSPVLAKPGSTDLFDFKPVSPTKKCHPTERPLDMISNVLTTFAVEGARVLVPFAGSGKTLIAAAQNKMVPIGYDISNNFRESYLVQLAEIFGEG
jgi:ParB/RepB/Spo0J family partition protein